MIALDRTHDPRATSWVPGADSHGQFPAQNLPLGIFSTGDEARRAGMAIGDWILDIPALAPSLTGMAREGAAAAGAFTLNALFADGNALADALRLAVFDLLTDPAGRATAEPHLHPAADCTLHLPFAIGDYTDFYTGIHHAENIGRQFRPDNPLLPNYKYVPIGYHGRASSIRPSGGTVIRPKGQRKPPEADEPVFGPSQRLDYELEMGVWIGKGNALGEPVPVGTAQDHVAGLALFNDWSARDLQAWEYQPLGPFLAKNFHSTVSPWVVTSAALRPFRMAQPPRPGGDPAPLSYLTDALDQQAGAYAVTMEVWLSTAAMRAAGIEPFRLSRGTMDAMYWTVAQLVAHHTVNGCDLHTGDLLATGTLSGPEPGSQGSLIELTEGGKAPIALRGGETRTFLQDGDEMIMTALAEAPGRRSIGFGECRARIAG
jgi:fumarylacetoacetase